LHLLPDPSRFSLSSSFAKPDFARSNKFLTAYLLYNDGVQTVISVAAIFAAQELGMETTQLILVILAIQFVAFGGRLGFQLGGKQNRYKANYRLKSDHLVWYHYLRFCRDEKHRRRSWH
jgi:UMF1 family MFS transporter